MDAHFVPNLTTGPAVVKALAKIATVPLDVHLMMDNPGEYIERFAEAGASAIGVHIEVTRDPEGLIHRIHDCGKRASLALNPGTPARAVEDYLGAVDQVLVMTVHPGYGGQKMIVEELEKVRTLRRQGPPGLDVEVDGGIDAQTAGQAVDAGANILVAGTSVFGAADRRQAVAALRRAARQG
jgi:ribulose-phosphate 3-epimerase